jgi:hypothetical protein
VNQKDRKIIGVFLIIVFVSVDFIPFITGSFGFVSADIQPPRASRNLKELVENLMSATPQEDRMDLDGDGIFDIVEVVIGTDYNNTDSDFDLLPDYQEVQMDSDPLDPDSNSDGLPDYNEVTNVTSLDLDGDNVTNIWDLDNDGDGLNDEVDLSPFSKSGTYDSFHFDLELNGEPTYIVLQFKPGNSENLKLYHQIWDWPSDSDGSMKDLDDSEEDLRVVPQLNVTVNILPSQEDVSSYGILVTDTGMNVPVYPVWENGAIVAFTAQIFYNTSVPMSLSMDAELIWRGIGYNDETAKAIMAGNGLYASVTPNGAVVANGSELTGLETFLWMEMGEEKVALKQHNGPYLSVLEDGSLVLGGYEPGENEIFQIIDMGNDTIALKASNGLYVSTVVLLENGKF